VSTQGGSSGDKEGLPLVGARNVCILAARASTPTACKDPGHAGPRAAPMTGGGGAAGAAPAPDKTNTKQTPTKQLGKLPSLAKGWRKEQEEPGQAEGGNAHRGRADQAGQG